MTRAARAPHTAANPSRGTGLVETTLRSARFGVVVLIGGVLAAHEVSASDGTAMLRVTATVAPTCDFASSDYELKFGVLDPSRPNDIVASTTVTFRCTRGTGYTLSDLSGTQILEGPGGLLPYQVAPFATSGIASGELAPIEISATIRGADYARSSAVAPGSYSDVLVLEIRP